MSCVIVANGQFPQSRNALDALHHAEYICCCDGAVEKLINTGFVPDVIVGDGDSISDEHKDRFADRFVKIEEQEYNDLTKATIYCVDKGFKEIVYLGATGLREDHTIGNIFLLPFYLENYDVEPIMITDEGVFLVYKDYCRLGVTKGQQISVFNITCSEISSKGLKWKIYPFKQLWQGTLNEASDDIVTIKANGIFMLFLQY